MRQEIQDKKQQIINEFNKDYSNPEVSKSLIRELTELYTADLDYDDAVIEVDRWINELKGDK